MNKFFKIIIVDILKKLVWKFQKPNFRFRQNAISKLFKFSVVNSEFIYPIRFMTF